MSVDLTHHWSSLFWRLLPDMRKWHVSCRFRRSRAGSCMSCSAEGTIWTLQHLDAEMFVKHSDLFKELSLQLCSAHWRLFLHTVRSLIPAPAPLGPANWSVWILSGVKLWHVPMETVSLTSAFIYSRVTFCRKTAQKWWKDGRRTRMKRKETSSWEVF